VTLVAILTVRRAALDQFRAFERHAATIMADHGGRIERTVVVTPAATPDLVKEIHVVTFPDERAFAAYRGDVRRDALAHLREASVVATEILVGEDGPRYEAGPVSGEGIRDARPEDHEALREVTLAAYVEYAALMGECLRRARAWGAPALTLHTTGLMQAAIRVYERLGFVRAPELDVEVAPGLTVSGYRLDFDRAGHTPYHTKPGA
jgi:GNAT superfamily N-acetyltransferase